MSKCWKLKWDNMKKMRFHSFWLIFVRFDSWSSLSLLLSSHIVFGILIHFSLFSLFFFSLKSSMFRLSVLFRKFLLSIPFQMKYIIVILNLEHKHITHTQNAIYIYATRVILMEMCPDKREIRMTVSQMPVYGWYRTKPYSIRWPFKMTNRK